MSRAVFTHCEICEEEIYLGEKYFWNSQDRFAVCEECVKNTTPEQLLIDLGFDYIEAEEDYDEWNRREL